MHSYRFFTLLSAFSVFTLLFAATSAQADKPVGEQAAEPAVKQAAEEQKEVSPLKVSGFISTTLYAQDRAFSPSAGQGAWFPAVGPRGDDQWLFDGDIRSTRLTLSHTGPKLEVLDLSGLVQIDFFGGQGASALTGDEQPIPRLRLAYVDAKLGKLTIRVGQDWSPLLGNTAKSLCHIAFPLGYGSGGKLGWRYPGIFLKYLITDADAPVVAKMDFAIMRGSWSGLAGQQGLPQAELRFDVGSAKKAKTKWNLYLAGHVDQKDMNGTALNEEDTDTLTGYAGQVGAMLKTGRLLLHGNAYYGRAIGQQFGHLLQLGDIRGWGGWAQIGVDIVDGLTAYVFYGVSDPDDTDIANALLMDGDGNWVADASAKERNQQIAVAIHYTIESLVVGMEYFRADLDHVTVDSAASSDFQRGTAEGQQVSLNVLYKF